ncbi:MAG: S8 family serine peptidase, partial [Caldilineaceae bacterium]|nr:S8 family serine peptidase [Caldilineaceae bacterium]
PGSSILSAYYTSDSATATLSGTSMASPHVAGAAALYLSTAPNASPAQVAQVLIDNASLNKLSSVGSGSPNRLLYTAFVGGGTPPTFTPTATFTPLPTATPTFTPTPLPTSTPTPTGQPTAQPSPTPTPTVTATPTQPPAACTNLLQNGDFEQGRTVWSESSTHGYALICNQTSCGPAIAAHRGQYLSWLGGANNEISEIRQPVTLPAGQNAYLSYWYDIESNDYCGYDYGYVRVIVDGVTRTLKRYSLCWSAETNGWANAQLDLSQYAGKTVTVVFRSTTDYSYSSSLFVDDVALTTAANCTAGLGPVEQVTELGGEDVSSAVVKPAAPAGSAEHER